MTRHVIDWSLSLQGGGGRRIHKASGGWPAQSQSSANNASEDTKVIELCQQLRCVAKVLLVMTGNHLLSFCLHSVRQVNKLIA